MINVIFYWMKINYFIRLKIINRVKAKIQLLNVTKRLNYKFNYSGISITLTFKSN